MSEQNTEHRAPSRAIPEMIETPWQRAGGTVAPPEQPLRALPFFSFAPGPMEVFEPERHLPPGYTAPDDVNASGGGRQSPFLPLSVAAKANPKLMLIPRAEDCYHLWDRYEMLDNIRAHSSRVAELAYVTALLAVEKGVPIHPEAVLAAGLLHDLGKTYTIYHGGNHAQLGAAWVMRETRNGPIAQSVLYHVTCPWEEQELHDHLLLVAFVMYADKRVMHDNYVTLDERFEDLEERYGQRGDYVRARMRESHNQGKRIEAALSRRLGVNLDEHTIDSGRLVKRA